MMNGKGVVIKCQNKGGREREWERDGESEKEVEMERVKKR